MVPPIDKLLEDMEAYQQGMQKGREMAVGKYDKILIELWEKMNDIEKKIDLIINELKKTLGKIK